MESLSFWSRYRNIRTAASSRERGASGAKVRPSVPAAIPAAKAQPSAPESAESSGRSAKGDSAPAGAPSMRQRAETNPPRVMARSGPSAVSSGFIQPCSAACSRASAPQCASVPPPCAAPAGSRAAASRAAIYFVMLCFIKIVAAFPPTNKNKNRQHLIAGR